MNLYYANLHLKLIIIICKSKYKTLLIQNDNIRKI